MTRYPTPDSFYCEVGSHKAHEDGMKETPDGVAICADCAKLPACCAWCRSSVKLADLDQNGHCQRCEPPAERELTQAEELRP